MEDKATHHSASKMRRGAKYIFDDHAKSLLRERYDSRPETITELSRRLRVPRHTVRRWAQMLGLARTKEQNWTEEEVRYLEAYYHRLHVSTIAKNLGRTTTAVALKAKRLGIRKYGEGYTASSLALALGVDSKTVARWIEEGALKATRRQTDRERDTWLILDPDVRDFIVRHPTEIDMRKVDGLWLIDLLSSGPVLSLSKEGGEP